MKEIDYLPDPVRASPNGWIYRICASRIFYRNDKVREGTRGACVAERFFDGDGGGAR